MTKSADPYINVNQAVVRGGDVDVESTNGMGDKAKKVHGRLTVEASEGSPSGGLAGKVGIARREDSQAVSMVAAREEPTADLTGTVTTSNPGQVIQPDGNLPEVEVPSKSANKAEWVAFAQTQGFAKDEAEAYTKDELVDYFTK
jgi:hypothetical protein